MTNTYIQSGAIDVKAINLSDLSGKKSYDLTAQILAFNIYEDLLFPVVRADFLFSDSLGLITEFPIIGEETIEVEFVTGGYEETLKYKMHTKSIIGQESNPAGTSKVYVITASSEEFITNNTLNITKKYSSSASDIVKNIMKDFIKTKRKYILEIHLKEHKKFLSVD